MAVLQKESYHKAVSSGFSIHIYSGFPIQFTAHFCVRNKQDCRRHNAKHMALRCNTKNKLATLVFIKNLNLEGHKSTFNLHLICVCACARVCVSVASQ